MSRNSPNGQAAARAQQRRQPTEQDAYDPYGAQQQAGYPHPGQHQGQPQNGYWSQPQQGYAEAPRYQGQQPSPYAQQHAPYGQQGSPYGQQQAGYGQPQPDPYGESAYGSYGTQPGYGSQPYAPMIPAPHPFGQPQGYGAREPDPHRGYAPQAPSQPMAFDHAPTPSQQGYASQPAPGSWQPQQAPEHDARGFDLSQYSPPSGDPGFQAQPADHFGAAPQDQFAGQQSEFADPDAAYDEGDAEHEEERPRTGRRMMMIAAALVGAIGIGGAMAYTYKTVFAGGRGGADKVADLKTKPGKDVSVSEKRLISRLDDPQPGTEPESAEQPSDDPNAPKKVRIIPMPGGSPTETAAAPAAPMPGIMLDLGPQPQRPLPPGAAPGGVRPGQMPVPPASANAGPRPAATAPVRTVSVSPPAQTSDAPPAAAAPVPKKERVKAPVPRASSDDQTASITPSAGSSGYVAVLASKKSRMDALKAFADLQQNHNDVLGTKTPDVQEANLGDKGMWYRAVVGPPGSREAAANLCGALKSAGYNGCWVTAY